MATKQQKTQTDKRLLLDLRVQKTKLCPAHGRETGNTVQEKPECLVTPRRICVHLFCVHFLHLSSHPVKAETQTPADPGVFSPRPINVAHASWVGPIAPRRSERTDFLLIPRPSSFPTCHVLGLSSPSRLGRVSAIGQGPARSLPARCGGPGEQPVGCDRSLPPTPQSPTVAASHGVRISGDPRRAAVAASGKRYGRWGRGRGRVLGPGGRGDVETSREGFVRTGERGAGGVGGIVGRRWWLRTEAGPGRAGPRLEEATAGREWGGGVTGHRGNEADLWGALGGVCASKGICVDPAWLQGVGQLEGAERDFWKSGVARCLTLREGLERARSGENGAYRIS